MSSNGVLFHMNISPSLRVVAVTVVLLGVLLVLPGTLVAATPPQESPRVAPDWDWSLPPHVKPVPYSGFVTWSAKRFHEWITVCGVHTSWRELNPAPGQYRWDLLEGRIAANRADGMRTGLHLMGVERNGIPDWVIERFHPPVIDVPTLSDNQPWRLQIVPPWHPQVEKAFLEFLTAFSQTGIARREEVVYAYIHGISASRGEELFLRPVDVVLLERDTGLTAEKFGQWLRRRTDAMLTAFRGAEHKLAWMSGGPVGPDDAYRQATADLWQYALNHGTGIRGGGIDFQHHLFESPAWASRVNEDGYCVVDDETATIRERRFRGDENEEYGKYWEWRFGPADQYDYRHRISSLRGLQMRQNFQMVSPETLKLNPELNRYVMLTQGYRREDSPDAWAYLRECQIRGPGRPKTVKNIERWLLQRDVPGSRSVAAERVDRFPLGTDPKDQHFDMDARRTDRAAGQDGLGFQLHRVFWSKPAAAEIKVTYMDRAPTRWHLAYMAGPGQTLRTSVVENIGDNQRKTATFPVPRLAAIGGFPGGIDFRLVTEGPGDLTITLVRVIHQEAR
jgi:hypothetical protein